MKSRCRRVFVAGSDTGVGKTLVAAALARLARRRGLRVAVYKPVVTGDEHARDAQVLARAAGWPRPGPLPANLLDVVAPIRFAEAAAPGVAARKAGARISWQGMIDDAEALAAVNDVLVIEGVGGLFVPLCASLSALRCVIDLMVALRTPALLVARTALGTINHSALSARALRARRVRCAAIILSQTEPGDEWQDAVLRDAIAKVSGVPRVLAVPHLRGAEAILVGAMARALDAAGVWGCLRWDA